VEDTVKPCLEIKGVSKTFRSKRGIFGRELEPVHAVDDVSFDVFPGEVVGLIGGSGSGKSTIARLILGLEKPDSGEILINKKSLLKEKRKTKRSVLKDIHLVFQDPYESMRSHMTLFDIVAEPLRIHGIRERNTLTDKVKSAVEEVNLPCDSSFLKRFPTELSGGQRQRLSFARAIVMNPKIIIADEPTSMLDVSLRTGLLDLMENLRHMHNAAFVFITHDLALARHFCDRILVLRRGRLIEKGSSDSIIHNPLNEYTKRLIEAAEEPEILKREFVRV
jgi:ABC-type glutathione transport system ATPase component